MSFLLKHFRKEASPTDRPCVTESYVLGTHVSGLYDSILVDLSMKCCSQMRWPSLIQFPHKIRTKIRWFGNAQGGKNECLFNSHCLPGTVQSVVT